MVIPMCGFNLRSLRQQLSVWPVRQAIALSSPQSFQGITVCDLTRDGKISKDEFVTSVVSALELISGGSRKLRARVSHSIEYIGAADINTAFQFYDLSKVLLLKKATQANKADQATAYAKSIISATTVGYLVNQGISVHRFKDRITLLVCRQLRSLGYG